MVWYKLISPKETKQLQNSIVDSRKPNHFPKNQQENHPKQRISFRAKVGGECIATLLKKSSVRL